MLIGALKVPGPGYGLVVDLQSQLPSDDLSGNTSGTEKADKGVKPKTLNCSFSLREKDLFWLPDFMKLSDDRDGGGEAIKYDVVHPLTVALRIRQMRFTGTVTVKQSDNLRAYDISFTLEEYRSVPEATEARLQKRTVNDAKPAESFKSVVDRIEAQTK